MESYRSFDDPGEIPLWNSENISGSAEYEADFSVPMSQDPPVPFGLADEPTMLKNDLNEDSIPTFYETFPTLQEISALVVAISLWRRVISLEYNFVFDSVRKIDYKEVEKSLDNLPAPSLIRKTVEDKLPCVRSEMENWLCYYKRHIVVSRRVTGEDTISTGDLLFCCWMPDGKIDHRESALNMLSNPKLTQMAKFKIMCRFCLEDEIKTLFSGSIPSELTGNIDPNFNPLLNYWLIKMTGDLDQIPKINGRSTEWHLITTSEVNTWPAIEYFWDRLDLDEKTCRLEEILHRKPKFQKNLYNKLSHSQKSYILSTIPVKFMGNFFKQQGQEQFALSTWIYIRNFIDREQFGQIMASFTPITPNIWENLRFLMEFWHKCPDHLKKLALQPPIDKRIMEIYVNHFCYQPCRDIEFLIEYLSYAGAEFRKKFILKRINAISLVIHPSVIDQLIELCLPNAFDAETFKKAVAESNFMQERLCLSISDNIRQFEKRVNAFLNYYCTDSNTRSEYCRNLLHSVTTRRSFHHFEFDHFINIVQFMDENLLPNLPDEAFKFKKILTLSFAESCCKFYSNDEKISKMIDIATQVFNAEDLQIFKRKISERIIKYYEWETFEENVLSRCLLWCCNNDDQRVSELKKKFSFDEIFEKFWSMMKFNGILQADVDRGTINKVFEALDKCLIWYFENDDDVKWFKLKKVFGNCKCKASSMFSLNFHEDSEVFARNTLPWFFQGDRDAIEFFKKINEDENIGRMI